MACAKSKKIAFLALTGAVLTPTAARAVAFVTYGF